MEAMHSAHAYENEAIAYMLSTHSHGAGEDHERWTTTKFKSYILQRDSLS